MGIYSKLIYELENCNDKNAFFDMHPGLRDNKTFMSEAIFKNIDNFKYASDTIRNDKDIVNIALSTSADSFEYIGNKYKSNKELALKMIELYALNITSIPDKLYTSEQFTKEAIKKNGEVLLYMHPMFNEKRFEDNKVLMLEAVSNNGASLEFVSKRLKGDKDIVLAAVKNYGLALKYSDLSLRNDEEIVLAAVSNNGSALKYASENLKDNRKIVLTAVQNGIEVLPYASERLRNDKQLVELSTKWGEFPKGIGDTLLKDKEFIYKLVESGKVFPVNLPYMYKDDVKFMTKLQKNGIDTLNFVSEEIKNNEQFAISAIEANSLDYYRIGVRAQDNERVILELLKNGNNETNMYISMFLIYGHNNNAKVLADKDLMVEAVSISGTALRFLSDNLKDDYEIVYEAVNQNEEAIQFASPRLQNNEVILKIIENKINNKKRN